MEIGFPFLFFRLYRYIYENSPVPLHVYDISESGIIESNNMCFNNFNRYYSKTEQIYLYIPTHKFLKVSLGSLISTPWTEEPDGLQSMELQRLSTLLDMIHLRLFYMLTSQIIGVETTYNMNTQNVL